MRKRVQINLSKLEIRSYSHKMMAKFLILYNYVYFLTVFWKKTPVAQIMSQ